MSYSWSQIDNLYSRSTSANLLRWGVRLVWLSYTIFLFVMTHTPLPRPVAAVTSSWDKPLHLGAYCVLAMLTALVCMKHSPRKVSHGLLLPVLMIYAAFDEILQGSFGRFPDVKDWTSDCLGILLGLFLIQVWILFLQQSNQVRSDWDRPGMAS